MTKKQYVCIRCNGFKDACTLVRPSGAMLPLMCGPDQNGYVLVCDWQEVPEKENKIQVLGKPQS